MTYQGQIRDPVDSTLETVERPTIDSLDQLALNHLAVLCQNSGNPIRMRS